jgi:hypothetical protein
MIMIPQATPIMVAMYCSWGWETFLLSALYLSVEEAMDRYAECQSESIPGGPEPTATTDVSPITVHQFLL